MASCLLRGSIGWTLAQRMGPKTYRKVLRLDLGAKNGAENLPEGPLAGPWSKEWGRKLTGRSIGWTLEQRIGPKSCLKVHRLDLGAKNWLKNLPEGPSVGPWRKKWGRKLAGRSTAWTLAQRIGWKTCRKVHRLDLGAKNWLENLPEGPQVGPWRKDW